MAKDTLMMLKRVILYDAIIMLLSFAVSMIFFREYAIVIIIGIIGVFIALVNFLLNAVIIEYAIKTKLGKLWILLGTIARIAIAAAFALILYNGDMKNIIFYLIGYSLHYISMIISAMTLKNKKIKGI
ncbi:MAG: hypothetical protein PHE79_00860 [Eubacteriales bacterium]|nr:hypothetical protein [Eubacteriales bacterium]